MTTVEKLTVINNRIALLKSRGETMNMALIKKQERKKRALLAKD